MKSKFNIIDQPASRRMRSNREFNNFIYDLHLAKYNFDNHLDSQPYDKTYFEENLFFITMHFKKGFYNTNSYYSLYNTKPIFDAFKLWYMNTAEVALGRKLNRTIKVQPLAIAYFDVEGSAKGNAAQTFQTPHIHATILLHPKNKTEYTNYLLSDKATEFRQASVSKIDILRFSDDGRGLNPMLSYSAKHARSEALNERFDRLFEIYPDVHKNSYPFFKSRDTHNHTVDLPNI